MKFRILVCAFCLLTSVAFALPEPGFDPKDVVRQVRSTHSTPRSASSQVPSDGSTLGPSDPVLDDGEFLIDTSVTIVPAPGSQLVPALAFDGVNFLVVWRDFGSESGRGVWGARVTPAGVVLDPSGILVSTAAGVVSVPALAFDGASFLVVWEDTRGGPPDIYGARVTPQGAVLDSACLAISQAAGSQRSPAVGFDSSNFLVVWEDERSNPYGDIYGARVTPAGVVLDTAGIAISRAAYGKGHPAVGSDSTSVLVVWEDNRSGSDYDIYGARVTPAGTVLDPTGIAISQAADDQYSPAVDFDGANFLVAWQDFRSDSLGDIYGARMTPQGAVLDTAGIAISRAASHQARPALSTDGANFLVAWQDFRSDSLGDIYGARVTPQGTVLDTAGIAVSTATGSQESPALAFDGANLLVVWVDGRSYGDIYGGRVTPAGVVLDPAGIAISRVANGQGSPAVGFDGANFLVVWEDNRSDSLGDIYGARVTPAGVVLDPTGFVISQAANGQRYPALAFDDANFLVVWEDYRSDSLGDIHGARVTPAGVVLDPSGILVSTAANWQGGPSLAFDGANFLVAWGDLRSDPAGDIYGARVTPAGVVLDPTGFVISQAANGQWYPALAFDGANFLAVWEDYRSGSDYDIHGARVTPQGTVLDPAGFLISQAADDQGYPAIGFDGTNFLVVWKDYRGSNSDIYGARVTPAGVVLDPSGIPVSTAAKWQGVPSLAFDGVNFLVAWQDFRSDSLGDIHGARVTPGGTVFDAGSVVSQRGGQSYPRLCCGSGSQMLLVYQGWTGTVGGKNYNTYRVWGKVNPSPAVAEMTKREVRMTYSGATIIRGMLFLPEAPSRRPQAASLLDISGRRVKDLRPGANDVSSPSPGVYFVRSASGVMRDASSVVTKVVIAR